MKTTTKNILVFTRDASHIYIESLIDSEGYISEVKITSDFYGNELILPLKNKYVGSLTKDYFVIPDISLINPIISRYYIFNYPETKDKNVIIYLDHCRKN